MQQEYPRLFPTQFKSGYVSGDEIDQEQPPNYVTAGKPRNSQIGVRRREEKQETLEVTVFRFVNADVYLIQCTDEDQHHRTSQTEDCQLERCDWLQPAS